MILALFAGLLPSFSVPDSSRWHYRLVLSGTSTSIPGAHEFYDSNHAIYMLSAPRASASAGAFRLTAHTPEMRRWTLHLGAALGQREQQWESVLINLLYSSLPVGSTEQKYEIDAVMTVKAPILEISAGAKYHFAQRHFLGLDAVFPLQLADGDLTYELDGKNVHTGKAPSSFRQSKVPRLMATYDYRLFDRIDLGVGVALANGKFFASIPEADIDSVGHIRLDSEKKTTWLEFHLGWTFGSARP